MGIDGLYKFINKNMPDIFRYVSINEIRGKSCIIDGMQHIYSQLIYMRSREKEIITQCGKNISHIHGLINSLTYYLKNGIIPIFIFDGKSPDIKKKKIEERKKNLKENLNKLKDLNNKKNNINEYILSNINELSTQIDNDNDNDNDNIIYGTPPNDNIFNLEEEMQRMNNLTEEYKKIYRKSIILKDYYIKDWIQILELLGIPVIKAEGEADPLCAYLLKNNKNIYGIISDDSDMLIFGAPILMRKTINQHFITIKLDDLLNNIELLLLNDYKRNIIFNHDNLIDFAILLGTDYGLFKLNKILSDSYDILKYYIDNNKDYKQLISEDQYESFEIIKKYYSTFNNSIEILDKLIWKKPKLLELKNRLLELYVDEDYIDKNNEFFIYCFNKIKNKVANTFNKNKFNNYYNLSFVKKSYKINYNFIKDYFNSESKSLAIVNNSKIISNNEIINLSDEFIFYLEK